MKPSLLQQCVGLVVFVLICFAAAGLGGLVILATLLAFWKRSPWAGGLLVPYLAWVSFAAVLNFTIWRLNLA